MTEKDFEREFAMLTPASRRRVADFISFLRGKGPVNRLSRLKGRRGPLDQEPFIGMWRDREDMKDSEEWVRKSREKEW